MLPCVSRTEDRSNGVLDPRESRFLDRGDQFWDRWENKNVQGKPRPEYITKICLGGMVYSNQGGGKRHDPLADHLV